MAYGKLASVSYAGIWEYYQYTSRGLMSQKTLTGAGGSSRSLVATYNWSTIGQLYQVDYPLNGVYGQSTYADDLQVHESFSYDAGGRLLYASPWVSDGLNNYTVSAGWNAQYNGANQLTQLSILGVTETRTYNSLNQLTRITSTGNIDIEYRYSATANDGRATSQKNWISGEEVQYTYDSLARLTLAETVGPQWGQSFSYDGWGNLLSKGVTKGAVPVMNLTVDGNTNRISTAGFGYDAAGNMTTMPFGGGSQTITYDHDNRVASVTNSGGTESYTYDTSNRRVVRNNGSQTEVTFYGIRGEKLGRYLVKTYSDGSKGFDLIEQYFYFGGRLTTKRPGSQFLTTGITRLTTDRLSSVGDGSTYYPYGEEKTVTANDKDKFATYYRDSLSGLDYAMNRYYSSTYGRFLSSDPYRASGGPSDPGSWNRFAYVQGDPVNRNDPSGLEYCDPSMGYYECMGAMGLLGPGLILDGPASGGGEWYPLSGLTGAAAWWSPVGAYGFNIGATAEAYPIFVTICAAQPELCAVAGLVIYIAWQSLPELQVLYNNSRENQDFRYAVWRYGIECGKVLSYDQEQRLHRAISKQGYTVSEIVEEAKGLFGCPNPQGGQPRRGPNPSSGYPIGGGSDRGRDSDRGRGRR